MGAESLILAEAKPEAQDDELFRFYGAHLERVDRTVPAGDFTGERLFRDRRDIYRMVVELLGEGISQRQIARVCHVSANTVRKVEERETVPIDAHKKQASRVLSRVVRSSAERLEELVPKMGDGAKVAVVLGIAAEKLQLLTGEATMRVESIEGGAALHRRFAEIHEGLAKMAQARVIEPDMDLAGGNAAVNAAARLHEGEVKTDGESDVFGDSSEVIKHNPDNLSDESDDPASSEDSAPGGEGVAFGPGVGSNSKG